MELKSVSYFCWTFFAYLQIVPFCSGLCQGPPPPTRYQIIHNASDPAVDSVNLFLGPTENMLKENFSYRSALPVQQIPSGPALIITAKLPNDRIFGSHIGYAAYRREPDEFYAVFLHGVREQGFASNPDSQSTAFKVDFYKVPERTLSTDSTHFVFVNGTTDLAKVKLHDIGNGTVDQVAAYAPQILAEPYPLKSFPLKANVHTLLLTDSIGSEQIGAFFVDLTTLGNQRAVLFTSGFKEPSLNKNGHSLGLFAALSDGTIIEFPRVMTTDIGNEREAKKAPIFPVPAQNRLYVQLDSRFSENTTLKLINQSGTIVWSRQVAATTSIQNTIEVNTEGIPQGLYLVTLTNDEGSQTLKCVIER